MTCKATISPDHSTWMSTRLARHVGLIYFAAILLQMSFGVTTCYVTTTKKPYTDSEICECPCIASTLNISEEAPTSVEEAVTKAEEIEKELTVDKTTTSSTTRTKVSVEDKRPSAKYVGVVGIVFISMVFGSIVLLDLLSCGKGQVQKDPGKKTKTKRQNKTAPDEGGTKPDAGGKQGISNTNFQASASAEHLSSGPTKEEVPERNYPSTSPENDMYSNRYLSVPYSSSPILVNRAPLSTRNRSGSNQLKDCLGHEDRTSFEMSPDRIRIRALVAPYQY